MSFNFLKKKHVVDTETQDNGARLVTFVEPKHVISEQFRTLRTNIEFAGAALDKLQVVIFTSAESSDGKTTVSSNVAVTWARAGKNVLFLSDGRFFNLRYWAKYFVVHFPMLRKNILTVKRILGIS